MHSLVDERSAKSGEMVFVLRRYPDSYWNLIITFWLIYNVPWNLHANLFRGICIMLWLKLTTTCYWSVRMRKSTTPTLQTELKKITVWTICKAALLCCRKALLCAWN